MILSPEERLRFAQYCRHEATTYLGLAEQMRNHLQHMPLAVAEHFESLASAYNTVAHHLEKIESA